MQALLRRRIGLLIALQLRQDRKWRWFRRLIRLLEFHAGLARKGIVGLTQHFDNILAEINLAIVDDVRFVQIVQRQFAFADLGNFVRDAGTLDTVDIETSGDCVAEWAPD